MKVILKWKAEWGCAGMRESGREREREKEREERLEVEIEQERKRGK
jgi:hypothetical protein